MSVGLTINPGKGLVFTLTCQEVGNPEMLENGLPRRSSCSCSVQKPCRPSPMSLSRCCSSHYTSTHPFHRCPHLMSSYFVLFPLVLWVTTGLSASKIFMDHVAKHKSKGFAVPCGIGKLWSSDGLWGGFGEPFKVPLSLG